jgi:hypothetical protein
MASTHVSHLPDRRRQAGQAVSVPAAKRPQTVTRGPAVKGAAGERSDPLTVGEVGGYAGGDL